MREAGRNDGVDAEQSCVVSDSDYKIRHGSRFIESATGIAQYTYLIFSGFTCEMLLFYCCVFF